MEVTDRKEKSGRAICEMHTDTRILRNLLEVALVKEGRTEVSYEELSAGISRNVQKEARGLLATARKHIEREHGLLLEPIFGVGLKVTNDYAGVVAKQTSHFRRISNRTIKRVLNATTGKDLDPEQRRRMLAGVSVLGAIRLCAQPKSTKKLNEYLSATDKQKELPTAETLRLFSNGK
jgi:hypothetical protein